MREVTIDNQNYLLVEVPDDAYDIRLSNDNGIYYYIPNSGECFTYHFGQDNINNLFEIIGKISDILKDEKVCKGLVAHEERFCKFKNYNPKEYYWIPYGCQIAVESFTSWLKSIDLDMTKSWLLIEVV